MAGEFLLATQFLTAAVMLGLAAWLLWLRFDHPLNRVFALFLIVRAGLTISQRFAFSIAEEPQWVAFWNSVSGYFGLLLPFILVYFLLVYLEPRGHRWYKLATAGLAVGTAVVFMVDHCTLECETSEGLAFGPLSVILAGAPIVTGLAGLWLARHVNHEMAGIGRSATGMIAGAFLLEAFLDSTIAWSRLAFLGWEDSVAAIVPNGWQWVPIIWFGLGIVPAVAGLAVLSWELRKNLDSRPQVDVLIALSLVAVATGMFVGAAPETVRLEWRLFVQGLWRLVIPTLIVIALVRHHLFGIDVRLKTAVKSSTIAGAFAAAFFVGSELLEELIPVNDFLLGLAAAGVIALALRPVQRLAQRVADRAFPGVKPFDQMDARERLGVFEEQARLVWADGRVGEKEQNLMGRLQDRLGIDPKDAKIIQQDAQRAFQERQGSPGGKTKSKTPMGSE